MIFATGNTRYEKPKIESGEVNGVNLPAISLGLWKTWSQENDFNMSRSMMRTAFDLGITHFNLTNSHNNSAESAIQNFGNDVAVDYHMHPNLFESSTVTAERIFGEMFKLDFKAHRDEMSISITAGGEKGFSTYGDHGSREYLVASIDQSLKRMGLDYVDIIYHHSPSRETALEETMNALKHIVDSGRALHIGFAYYSPRQIFQAVKLLEGLGTPCVAHQFEYDIFKPSIENSVLDSIGSMGLGSTVSSAFVQDLLLKRDIYHNPAGGNANIDPKQILHHSKQTLIENAQKVKQLKNIAMQHGQSTAKLMIAWMLGKKSISSILLEATSQAQIQEAAQVMAQDLFTKNDLIRVDKILTGDHYH